MAALPNKIRITVGSVQLDAELKSTKTAQEVYAALPVESSVNTWGEEFYFKLAGVKDHPVAQTATSRIPVIGQAVLGFILPWILAMVAVPLETMISTGGHIVLSAATGLGFDPLLTSLSICSGITM